MYIGSSPSEDLTLPVGVSGPTPGQHQVAQMSPRTARKRNAWVKTQCSHTGGTKENPFKT